MKAFILPVLLVLSFSALAADTSSTPVTGQSVVTVSQSYTNTQPQALNSVKVDQQAKKMCLDRGYASAERLGEEQQSCSRYTGWYQCFYRRVDQQYRCVGK